MIADLLLQYEKVIYLDCDICILADLKELYEISLDHMVVGMAKAIIGNDSDFIEYVKHSLQPAKDQY